MKRKRLISWVRVGWEELENGWHNTGEVGEACSEMGAEGSRPDHKSKNKIACMAAGTDILQIAVIRGDEDKIAI